MVEHSAEHRTFEPYRIQYGQDLAPQYSTVKSRAHYRLQRVVQVVHITNSPVGYGTVQHSRAE